MSLSTQGNVLDATELTGNTWEGSQLVQQQWYQKEKEPVKEDNESDRTKYSSSNEFLWNYAVLQKKTQPEEISWVGKFLYHSHDTLSTELFVSRNAISWPKGRSCVLRSMELPVVILKKSTMTLAMSYLHTSYQKLSAEKWLLVTCITTRHTEPKWADYSRNAWGHFILKFLSLNFQNLLEKKA